MPWVAPNPRSMSSIIQEPNYNDGGFCGPSALLEL